MSDAGDAQSLQRRIDRYLKLIESQPELNDHTIPLHLALAKLYEQQGKTPKAIHEYALIAFFYADRGQVMKAIAAAQMIVRLDPENDELIERLEELFVLRKTVSSSQLEDYNETINTLDTLAQQDGGEDEAEFAEDEITSVPITEIAPEEVLGALKQIDLFSRLSVSELRGLQTYSLLSHFAPDEPILPNGNVRRSLFVILKGRIKIFGKDKEGRPTFLAELKEGASFGEFALFGRVDQSLSVVSSDTSAVLEIPRDVVMKLAKMRPHITQTLKDLYKRRILESALARVPLFSQLAPEERRRIVSYFKAVKAKKGTTLVREGDLGKCMYFILIGKVGVYTSLDEDHDDLDGEHAASGSEELLLATLSGGDFFGEQALVTQDPRSATVKALTDVGLLRFSKDDLDEVIKEYPNIESELQIEAFHHRMQKRLTILKNLIPDEAA